LQEEQTEVPSGGRETLAWLEEAAMNAVQSSSPAAATSFDDEILPASAPVENTLSDAMACSSMFKTDSTNEDWKSKSTHPIEELACRGSPLKWLFSHLMGTKSGDKDIKQVKKKKP
jgi:hypothetical protein